MKKKLRASYALRPETLIRMLHSAYVMGYVTAVCDADDTDDEPIPMDKDGPRTELWIDLQIDALMRMRRRRDGTYYPPENGDKRAPLSLCVDGDEVLP
jgi:hypothetical protein